MGLGRRLLRRARDALSRKRFGHVVRFLGLLRHLRVLRLEPGDTLVFQTNAKVSPMAAARIREQITRAFPGHRVVVVENARLEVARTYSREEGDTSGA